MTRPVKLSCNNIWMVFGPRPRAFLERHKFEPTLEDFQAESYIGACRNVTFDVHEGEILMVMGLSGSGKSTLVRCITRLLQPTHGEVLFDGKDLLSASRSELIEIRRHKMGMVFQHFGLLPHRTVLENVIGVDAPARIGFAAFIIVREVDEFAFELGFHPVRCPVEENDGFFVAPRG